MTSLNKRILISLNILATMVMLSGCYGKNYALEGTLLDKAVVGTVDGNTAFLRVKDSNAPGNYLWDKNTSVPSHKHYTDIINGEILTDYDGCASPYVRKSGEIEITDDVFNALTPEELEKAMNNGLTNQDLVDILTRIREEKEKPVVLNKKGLVAIY